MCILKGARTIAILKYMWGSGYRGKKGDHWIKCSMYSIAHNVHLVVLIYIVYPWSNKLHLYTQNWLKLFYRLVGCPPFWHRKQMYMLRNIMEGKYSFSSPEWEDISEPPKDLVSYYFTTICYDLITALNFGKVLV